MRVTARQAQERLWCEAKLWRETRTLHPFLLTHIVIFRPFSNTYIHKSARAPSVFPRRCRDERGQTPQKTEAPALAREGERAITLMCAWRRLRARPIPDCACFYTSLAPFTRIRRQMRKLKLIIIMFSVPVVIIRVTGKPPSLGNLLCSSGQLFCQTHHDAYLLTGEEPCTTFRLNLPYCYFISF